MDPQKERELMKTELCGGSDSCLVSMEDVKIEISSHLFFMRSVKLLSNMKEKQEERSSAAHSGVYWMDGLDVDRWVGKCMDD